MAASGNMSAMAPDSQSQSQFDLYGTQYFDPPSLEQNPQAWAQPTQTPTPTPSLPQPAPQPWELPKSMQQNYHQNYVSSASPFPAGAYAQAPAQQAYPQFSTSTYPNQPPVINTNPGLQTFSNSTAPINSVSATHAISPVAIQPKSSMVNQSAPSMLNSQVYQSRQGYGNSVPYSVPNQQALNMPAGSFMTSAGVIAPTTVPIDEIPKPPGGEKSITHPQFTIIEMPSLMDTTNSRPFSKYISLSAKSLELPYSKVAQVPKFDDSRTSLRQLRQGRNVDIELKSKLDRIEKKSVDKTKSRSLPGMGMLAVPIVKGSPSPSSHTESSSEESGDDESDYEEDQSPLPASRPADPVRALEYDVIKSVWHPHSKSIQLDVLGSRITQFSDLFLNLRDQWKKANELVKQAVEAKQNSQLPGLKSKVSKQRQLIESTINNAIKYGHRDILKMLGESRKLLAVLQQLLVDRAGEKDYSGQFSLAILKFLTHITNLTTEVLELTKLTKVLAVFTKRGSDEIKAIVKSITDSASSASANNDSTSGKATPVDAAASVNSKPAKSNAIGVNAKYAETKSRPTEDSKPATSSKAILEAKPNSASRITSKNTEGKPKAESNPADVTSGVKRIRSSAEILAVPSAKRQAVSISMLPSKSSTTTASAAVKKPLTTIGSKSSATASSTSAAPKPKASVPGTAKASNFFSSMQSSVKKPQTMSAENTTSGSVASTTVAASASASRTGFSLGGIIDGLMNPKAADAKAKSDEQKPVETEEEKVKRLRKETRRKLRVSWKPDLELVSIREFTHDPDEDTGHDASSVRDAGDILNEGKAFKEGLKHQDPLMDEGLDDEEESEDVIVESFDNQPVRLSIVDADGIDASERDKNYVRFLGPMVPDSPERNRQQEREMNTLMALYMKRSEIPPRPRSPIESYSGEPVQTIEFGRPEQHTATRLKELQTAAALYAPTTTSTMPNFDIAAILSVLAPAATASPAAQQAVPQQAQTNSNPYSNLEAIFAQHSASAAPQTQHSVPSTTTTYSYNPPPAQVPSNPLLAAFPELNASQPGHYTPPQPTASTSNQFNSILAALTAHNQTNASQNQAYVPPPAVPPSIPPETASLLAQLGLGQPNYAAYTMPQQLQQQQTAQQPQLQQSQPQTTAQPDSYFTAAYEHPDRKRVREGADDEGRDDGYKRVNVNNGTGIAASGGGFGNKWDRNKPKWPKAAVDDTKKFTLPCKFWPEGKCRKGSDCTYRHDSLT